MNALETPRDISAMFADAWNARDASALARMFADDADFVNVGGLWWHKRADIEQAHDYCLQAFFKDSTLSIRQTKDRFGSNCDLRYRLALSLVSGTVQT